MLGIHRVIPEVDLSAKFHNQSLTVQNAVMCKHNGGDVKPIHHTTAYKHIISENIAMWDY